MVHFSVAPLGISNASRQTYSDPDQSRGPMSAATDVGSESVLEALPIGLIEVHGDSILSMNRVARGLFGGRYHSVTELGQDNPLALVAVTAEPRTGQRWINIDGAIYYRDQVETERGKATLLVPASYMDLRNPELQELRQRYGDFLEIFDNCYDGIYVADGKGKTLWLNSGFERAYGVSRDQFIGKDARELERQGYAKPLITWKVISTGNRITVVHRTSTGKRVLATGIPLFDENRKVRKVIVNSRDMTELHQLREQLNEAEKSIARYESELERFRRESGTAGMAGLVFKSDRMRSIVELAQRLAKVDTAVLVTGESGVGKEVVAKLIHEGSDRKEGRLVKINCGAIPEQLLESELFGYEKGAFTGSNRQRKPGLLEVAQKGTLFLDEIGEMPLDLQVKLLQVLQDKAFTRVGGTEVVHVDFRVVAATNRDLEELIQTRRFREDLYYRLSVVPLKVPPLRDRPEDVLPLLEHFLAEFNERHQLAKRFSEAVLQRLLEYHWPGNVRELRNLVERMVVISQRDVIGISSLPEKLSTRIHPEFGAGLDFQEAVAAYERKLAQAAVEKYGNVSDAARKIGISESTIKRKLRANPAGAIEGSTLPSSD